MRQSVQQELANSRNAPDTQSKDELLFECHAVAGILQGHQIPTSVDAEAMSCCASVFAIQPEQLAEIPDIEHGSDAEVFISAQSTDTLGILSPTWGLGSHPTIRGCARKLDQQRIATVAAAQRSRGSIKSTDAPIVIDGLEDWSFFRLDRATRSPSQPLYDKLTECGCFFDEDRRAWSCVEEIVIDEAGEHRWPLSERGTREPPLALAALVQQAEACAYEPASLAVAHQEASLKMRRQIAAVNRKIDEDYRQRVGQALAQGEVSEDDIRNDDLAESTQMSHDAVAIRRRVERVRRRTASRRPQRGAQTFSARPEWSAGVLTQPPQQAKPRKRIVVSTVNGQRTPARLMRLGVRAPDGSVPLDVNIELNIADTGSGAELMGLAMYEWLVKELPPGSVRQLRRDEKLATSIDHVTGIGGFTPVLFHVALTLDVGGVPVEFTDIAVLANHRGFLIGNDSFKQSNAQISYYEHTTIDGLQADGDVVLRDDALNVISTRVPFTVSRMTEAPSFVTHAVAECFSTAATQADAIPESAPPQTGVKESVVPIAFVPATTKVESWAQQNIRCRVPKAATVGKEVLILPLEDERLQDLGVLVAPSVSTIDSDGYCTVRVINPSLQPIVLPLLTPLARFVVDPRVSGADLEFETDEILELIHLPPDITEAEREYARKMIASRRRLFATTLGWAHGYKQVIDTPRIDKGEVPPPAFPMRNRSPAEWAALKESIDKQLKQRLIERCCSPYNAIPMTVKKPDGSWRVVIDFRALNNLTKRDVYPLPNIEANLAALGKVDRLTVIDLLMGFHQCELEESSKAKTAFGTPWGQMCYTRMPMGLTSSPGAFMRLVDAALRGLDPGTAWPYLDDLIVPTAGSWEHHIDKVGLVFDKLIEAGFTVRCDKVHVGLREVAYLGFLVGAYGTRPAPKKVTPILSMTIAQLQADKAAPARFAGMMAFYHRFIENLSFLLGPFYDLRKNDAVFHDIVGSLRLRTHFEYLKLALANATALARPDYSKPFYIDVDAATIGGVGAALSQRTEDDDPESHRPLGFYSRRFDSAERAYPVRDQECMALVEAVVEWRPYILGHRTIVRSDHKSLAWLMSCQHPDGSRVSNWALRIQEYGVEIVHIPGKLNVVPDCLSRAVTDDDTAPTAVCVATADDQSSPAPAHHTEANHTTRIRLEDSGTGPGDDVTELICAIVTAAAGDAEVDTAATTVAFTGTVAATKSPHARVAAVLLTDEGDIILERQGDTVALPGIAESRHCGSARGQLVKYIATIFKEADREAAERALVDQFHAQLVYPRKTTDTAYLVCRLPAGITSQSFIQHPLVTYEAHKFDDRVVHSVSEDVDYTFLRHLSDITNQKFVCSAAWFFRETCKNIVRSVTDRRRKSEKDRRRQTQQLATMSLCTAGTRHPPTQSACAFNADVITISGLVPRVTELLDGPALCETTAEFRIASRRLHERLRASTDRCMSIDLEGELGGPFSHIALIQISVEANGPNESPLTYVFNAHRNPDAVGERGIGSLRQLLEDPAIVKIFHHCRGDVAALFVQFKITVANVFDTAVADCLTTFRHHNCSRNLQTVLFAWLGDDVVHLQYKGKLVHTPRMFEVYPLPYHLFVYAYEDVTYGTALFRIQRAELEKRGIMELQHSLSAMRVPPRSLPTPHRSFAPARNFAIALVDDAHIVCLRHRESDSLEIPMQARVEDNIVNALDLKRLAGEMWSRLMGAPAKGVACAVKSRLQKPVRFRLTHGEDDCLLFLAHVPDCVARLDSLRQAFASTVMVNSHELVLKDRIQRRPAAGCEPSQAALFQYLHATALMAEHKQSPVSYSYDTKPSHNSHTLRIRLDLAVSSNGVTATTSTIIHPSPTADACVVTGKTVTDKNAAIILCDEAGMAYAIKRSAKKEGGDDTLEWPTVTINVKEDAAEAAVRALDLYIGPSARKGYEGATASSKFMLVPKLGPVICKALEKLQPIGLQGNTEYFVARLPADTIAEQITSFHAVRQEVNSFRLTVVQKKRHPGFVIVQIADMKPVDRWTCLSKTASGAEFQWRKQFDIDASESISSATAPTVDALDHARLSHHTEAAATVGPEQTGASAEALLASVSEPALTTDTHSDPAEAVGTDPEFDKLFEARVAIEFGLLCAQVDAATTALPAKPGLPEGDDCDAIGATPRFKYVTRAEILAEQQKHPALMPYIDFLLTGDISSVPVDDQKEFRRVAMGHHLAEDGVLMMTSTGKADDRTVLPPALHQWCMCLYHDRQGHFGLQKTMNLITRKYVWGTEQEMRTDVGRYLRACHPCLRNKLSRHQLGAGQLAENGEHPNDIVSCDFYKTGCTASSGADTIVSFADHFTRAVYAVARVGDATSEEFAQTLIEVIVSHYGVPRVIRTDHDSVLVADAIKKLYAIFGIKMRASTPYMHRSIGLVERWHSTLKRLLLIHRSVSTELDWDKYLPLLQLAFNSAVSATTGYSPFFVTHMRHPRLPVDNMSIRRSHVANIRMPDWVSRHLQKLQVTYDAVARTLKLNALSAKRAWDLKREVCTQLIPGDRVLVIKGTVIDGKHQKATEPTHGPYTVIKVLPQDNYQLSDLKSRRVIDIVHISQLIYFPSRRVFDEKEEQHRYPVRAIVGHRVTKVPLDARGALKFAAGTSVVEYRIRWRGFSRSYDSWRSAHYLADVFELVTAYREMVAQRGGAQLPPDAIPPPAVEARDNVATPSPAPIAKLRKHFRAVPERDPAPVEPAVPAADPQPETAAAPSDDGVEYAGTDDIYPCGSRVNIKFENGWWPCTVVSTFVSRPRSKSVPAERRIVVQYEDTPELWEHGLRGTPVQLISAPAGAASHPDARVIHPTPTKTQRRAERIFWALRPNPNPTRALRSRT